MSWSMVALIAIGAFVVIAVLYLVVWGIFAKKVFRSHDKFFKDDFFNRRH